MSTATTEDREASAMGATGTDHHPADRLLAAVDRCSAPVCVGIDPVLDRLPSAVRSDDESVDGHVASIAAFVDGVLSAVAGVVPSVKFQAACYERYGWRGVRQLESDIASARAKGLEVILDAKRGDIGVSASHYAAAAFGGESSPDRSRAGWITINGYLGSDGINPFLERPEHGAFVLVRTSNPSGDRFQGTGTESGACISDALAAIVAEIGDGFVGQRGFSALGAVVGATKPADAARLRTLMPKQIFLVPGYGAQGGGVDDVLPSFHEDGTGAIVTASRSVLYPKGSADSAQWADAVRSAAEQLASDIGGATGHRSS